MSVKQADDFIRNLVLSGKDYHPDDPPGGVVIGMSGVRLFSDDEAERVDELMVQAMDQIDVHCALIHWTNVRDAYSMVVREFREIADNGVLDISLDTFISDLARFHKDMTD